MVLDLRKTIEIYFRWAFALDIAVTFSASMCTESNLLRNKVSHNKSGSDAVVCFRSPNRLQINTGRKRKRDREESLPPLHYYCIIIDPTAKRSRLSPLSFLPSFFLLSAQVEPSSNSEGNNIIGRRERKKEERKTLPLLPSFLLLHCCYLTFPNFQFTHELPLLTKIEKSGLTTAETCPSPVQGKKHGYTVSTTH